MEVVLTNLQRLLLEGEYGPLIRIQEASARTQRECKVCHHSYIKYTLEFQVCEVAVKGHTKSIRRTIFLCESCLFQKVAIPTSDELQKAVDNLVRSVVRLQNGAGPEYLVCPVCDERIAVNESDETKWPRRSHRVDRSGTVVLRCPRLVA